MFKFVGRYVIIYKLNNNVFDFKEIGMKKFVSISMACALLANVSVFASEEAIATLEGHWAEDYIVYLNEKNVVMPTAGTFTPDTHISRAEFMRYVNRAFNYQTLTDVDFSDVTEDSWYYSDVQKAVYQEYIQGTGNGEMNPLGKLTRQEAVVIISRLHNIEPSDNISELNFTDASDIDSWASPYIANAVQSGYITGHNDGSFEPKGYITRAQISKILYLFGGTLLEDGTQTNPEYNEEQQNLTISKGDTILKDTTVTGDLLISAGVLDGVVELNSVKVLGDIIISGGEVDLIGVTASNVIIKAPQNNEVSVYANSTSQILNTTVYTNAELSGAGFNNVIEKMNNSSTLTLDGTFREVVLTTDTTLDLNNAEVAQLIVNDTAKGSQVVLENSNIDTATVNAQTDIYGDGSVHSVMINANDVTVSVSNTEYNVASGCTAYINGVTISGKEEVKIYTTEFTIDPSLNGSDIVLGTTFKSDELLRITYNGTRLYAGTDYSVEDNKITLYRALVNGFDTNYNVLTFVMKTVDDILVTINYADKSENSINIGQLEYDKNQSNTDVEITLTPSTDRELVDIYYGGYKKLTSDEYRTSGNKIYFYASYLNTLADGNAVFTFEMSGGNKPELVIDITNSAPPNAVTPSEIVFDKNIASTNYDDVIIMLESNEGVLTGIYNGEEQLVENVDYVVSGEKITIRREYLVNIDSTSNVNLAFKMSKGQTPSLAISIITSNPSVVTINDENGLPVQYADVTIDEQTLQTDKNGQAFFNLTYGIKTVEVSKDGFISKTESFHITVSSTKEKTIEILYSK